MREREFFMPIEKAQSLARDQAWFGALIGFCVGFAACAAVIIWWPV